MIDKEKIDSDIDWCPGFEKKSDMTHLFNPTKTQVS